MSRDSVRERRESACVSANSMCVCVNENVCNRPGDVCECVKEQSACESVRAERACKRAVCESRVWMYVCVWGLGGVRVTERGDVCVSV